MPKFACLRVLIVAVASASFLGQIAAQESPTESGSDYFEQHIRPLFSKNCFACHSRQREEVQGGLSLDSPQGWQKGGEHGPSVVPGDLTASLLLQAVRYEAASGLEMPPSNPLTKAEISKLERWVAMGAPGPHQRSLNKVDNPSDPVHGKSHWAFQPLDASGVPKVSQAEWPRTPLDYYILAQLEVQHIAPGPAADPSVVARRAYLLLTGLPPSPEKLDAFLQDPRADRFTRLVDQLLGSPQYGETWGRHWLDLARYADSNGLDENFLYREAWRYRNWVIDAVNTDMPVDRFILEQVAGDLLPFDSLEQRDRQRIASGFLVIGPKVLLGIEPERQRMDIADEQLDTIGRAILGQTLGCARCHDHKFDPIPTADYYALSGIFTSTDVMEKRYMLGQQRVMERLVGLGDEGEELDAAYEEYWREQPKLKERLKRAEKALTALTNSDEEQFDQIKDEDSSAIAAEAEDTTHSSATRIAAQQALLDQTKDALDHPPAIPPRAMIPADVSQPRDEPIRLAGQFDAHGETVSRGFPRVLLTSAPAIATSRSGRLELAHWLTDVEQPSGVLAARVYANRVWHHLIGRGLVRTVDNFGRTGEEPTHLALLDYLARLLIDSGWSTKALVREIVLSSTFATSSAPHESARQLDPENQLLWRAHRRRLSPESLRDSILAAADQLDYSPMDSTVWYLQDQATAVGANEIRRRTDFPCRSIYLPVIRNDLPELFEVFDFADPHIATGARDQTLVPTQALFMLNDEMLIVASEAIARRVLASSPSDLNAQISQVFQLLLNDEPSATSREAMHAFVAQMAHKLSTEHHEHPRQAALALACHALFASSQFQFLE